MSCTGGRVAIAIDEENRPSNALAFAALVRDGARGISPFGADAATAHLGGRRRRGSCRGRDRAEARDRGDARVIRDDRAPARSTPPVAGSAGSGAGAHHAGSREPAGLDARRDGASSR